MQDVRTHRSHFTGALIHQYRPIRVHIVASEHYPQNAANFLVRILLGENKRYAPMAYLFELTSSPDDCDFQLYYADLNFDEGREDVILTRLSADSARVLFVDHRDDPSPFAKLGVHLKPSLAQAHVGPDTIAIPYMEAVDDFRWEASRPRRIDSDLSFIGETTALRSELAEALQATSLQCRFRLHRSFFHKPMTSRFEINHGETPFTQEQRDELRREFVTSVRRGRFALAPRGYGLNSFRFYEALSLGVPPILVSDDCALPFDDEIDYGRFSMVLPTDTPATVKEIGRLLASTDERQLEAMGREGRAIYERFLSYEAALLPIHQRLERLLPDVQGSSMQPAGEDTTSF
jgi:Exostosin family